MLGLLCHLGNEVRLLLSPPSARVALVLGRCAHIVRDMTIIASGLVTLLNGFLSILGALASPVVIASAVIVVSVIWLASLEVSELDLQSAKPEVGRH